MIKIDLFEQGSDEWHQARLGRITGTAFSSLVAGKSTKTYQDLVLLKAGEILSGETEETYVNENMRRGTDLEPIARESYIYSTENQVEEVGFILPDEDTFYYNYAGVSPDGLLVDSPGFIEIKCPLLKTHMKYISAGVVPGEYKHQLQGNLFITGLEFCDFVSFYPGMKPFIKRVFPNFGLFEEYKLRLKDFIEDVNDVIEKYNHYDYL